MLLDSTNVSAVELESLTFSEPVKKNEVQAIDFKYKQ